MIQQVVIYARTTGTSPELLHILRQTVEDRGDKVVAAYQDDAEITGRGKYTGWRSLFANLDTVDQIVVVNAGDIPSRTVADLLKVLATLRDRGTILHLHSIETGTTTCAVLDIVAAFRRSRLSQAIRAGQAKAVAAGRRLGRPPVPVRVQGAIRTALANGGGIRPTARKFNVSPAFVINVKQAMADTEACTY